MIGKTNSGGVLAILNVNCPYDSTVTVVNGNLSFTAIGRSVSFKLPRIGDWIVTATRNGLSQAQTVTMSAGQTSTITLLTDIYLFSSSGYAIGFTRGWTYGDYGTYVETTGNVNGNNPSLSNGFVDLTGYKHLYAVVQYRVSLDRYAWGGDIFSILNAYGSELAQQGHSENTWRGWEEYQPPETWTFDVTNINQLVQFKLWTNFGSGGSAESGGGGGIILHSIRITTT